MAKKSVLVSLDVEVWEETRRQCKEYGLSFSYVVNRMLQLWNRVRPRDERTESEKAKDQT